MSRDTLETGMFVVCLDLEGIITPEVWINVARVTGVDELKLTTRDIDDYDILMRQRLQLLQTHHITLSDIQEIIRGMELLPGAREFIDWLRTVTQVIILSDTFIEFGQFFMQKLGYPTLLCHELETDEDGLIIKYRIRIPDQKMQAVTAFKQLNYEVIAIGDSYNDMDMLCAATHGILFRPPPNIITEFPQFTAVTKFSELRQLISDYLGLAL